MQQDYLVNTNTAGVQSNPVIAKLGSNGWVVIWFSDTNSGDLRGQMYAADGSRLGGEFQVTASTAGAQNSPSVAATPDGGFIVAWTDSASDGYLRAQHFTSAGVRTGAEVAVTAPANYQSAPHVKVATDGSYLISYTVSTSGQPDQSWIARYDAAGNKLGVDLNMTSLTGTAADWVAISAGHYVATYTSGSDVRARFIDIDSSGVHAGTAFLLNDPSMQYGTSFAVNMTELSDGSFAATWSSYSYNSGFYTSYPLATRTFDSTGTHGAIAIASDLGPFITDVHIAPLASGYVVSWGGYIDGDSSLGAGSFARVFDNAGDALGGRIQVNVTPVGTYAGASVAGLDGGGFAAAFGGGEIRWRPFDAPLHQIGTPGDDHLAAISESTPAQIDGLGGNDTIDGGVLADSLHGDAGNDIINGNDGDDIISGDAGADTLSGGAGNDHIYAAQAATDSVRGLDAASGMDGGIEVDTLSGGAGKDSLFAGFGDNVDGGTDVDTLYYSARGATSGVHFDLSTAASQVVGGGTIANIELLGRFDGSDFNDVVVGGTADSLGYATWETNGTIYGYGGNDQLTAGYYAPRVYGGDGNDTIVGSNAAFGLSVLVGGAGADTIYGGTGNDFLSSADGDAEFPYFPGAISAAPVFDHGTEVDTVSGGAGDDTVMIGWGDNADGGSGGESRGDALVVSLYGATSGVTIDFNTINQTYNFGGGVVTGFERIDWVEGSQFADTISFGNPANGTGGLPAGSQNVVAGAGDDIVTAGYYTQYIDGGDGNDTLDGRNDSYLYEIDGGAGKDTIYGHALVHGGDGDDQIYGAGDFYGDAGNDLIVLADASGARAWGGDGNDIIQAGNGGQTLAGGAGADTLTGGTGADTIYSNDFTVDPQFGLVTVLDDVGTEHDVIQAGGGNDKVWAGYGDDADGGTGTDSLTLSLAGASAGMTINTADLVSATPITLGGGTIQNFETLTTLRGTEFGDTITVAAQATRVTINAGGGDDFITLKGGQATLNGGDGNDAFYVGSTWVATDRIFGGTGNDQLGVQGNYANLVLGVGSLNSIEEITFLSGSDARFGDTAGNSYSYNVTAHDSNVFAGYQQIIQANSLGAGESLTFNGAAETDGSFLMYGGLGNDHLTGGQQNDGFYFGVGRFGASDVVDGQGGTMDQLGLQGDYSGANAIHFGAGQISNIEMIVLLSGADTRFNGGGSSFSYTLTMDDANAGAGSVMAIQANTLRAGEHLVLDASAEANASYHVYGGADSDTITTGAGSDILWGNAGDDTLTGGTGADELHGGTGNDSFVYLTPFDSQQAGPDYIVDFTHGDRIDVSAAGFDTFHAGGFTHTAGEMTAIYSGSTWFIEGDSDGNGIADLFIVANQASDFVWSAADFHLGASPINAIVPAPGNDLAHVALSSLFSSDPVPVVEDDPTIGLHHLMLDRVSQPGYDHIL